MASHADAPRHSPVAVIAYIWVSIVLAWTLYEARSVLLLLYVAGLFAVGLGPMVRFVERQQLIGLHRLPRWLAILSLYLMVLSFLTGVLTAVLPPLIRQAREFVRRLPELFDRAQNFLIGAGVLDHRFTLREAVEAAPGNNTDAVGTVLGAVVSVVGGLFGLVTILILTFYLLVDAEAIFRTFVRLFPVKDRPRVAAVSREISGKVSAWLVGQLLLAGIIGSTAALGLWIMGVPFFYVLALIAAVGELIPVVGPLLAAIPAILVALSVSPSKALFVAIFFLVQQQLENHVLVPKLMGRQVGISAVVVIAALLLGGALLGIVGAILAIPTAAIVSVLFMELVGSDPPSES